jgi:hypothetical protein
LANLAWPVWLHFKLQTDQGNKCQSAAIGMQLLSWQADLVLPQIMIARQDELLQLSFQGESLETAKWFNFR